MRWGFCWCFSVSSTERHMLTEKIWARLEYIYFPWSHFYHGCSKTNKQTKKCSVLAGPQCRHRVPTNYFNSCSRLKKHKPLCASLRFYLQAPSHFHISSSLWPPTLAANNYSVFTIKIQFKERHDHRMTAAETSNYRMCIKAARY